MLCGISFNLRSHTLYVFIDVWCLDIAGMKRFPESCKEHTEQGSYHFRITKHMLVDLLLYDSFCQCGVSVS